MLNEIDLSRTDLNLLVLYEAVLRERHVGRAAERLNLTPSAVSHGLGRLRRLLHDPLFLRTPRGVVPTARALALADPVAEILAAARRVIATAEPFDPATSTRRFTVGAPDGVSAWLLPTLLDALGRVAPGVDLAVRQLLPPRGGVASERAWAPALEELEARAMDLAVVPLSDIPARFEARLLYEEDFVVAARRGHPFLARPTLARYCGLRHAVVSLTGDAHGFVDIALEAVGRRRRVALVVPNFMMAMAAVSGSDLVTAVPRRFAAALGARFGVAAAAAPLALPRYGIRAVAQKAALRDAGVAWLFAMVCDGRRA